MINDDSEIWVLSATSESGDDYGPWVFSSRPHEDQIEEFLREQCPSEWEDEGPGFRESYLHINLIKTELQKNG